MNRATPHLLPAEVGLAVGPELASHVLAGPDPIAAQSFLHALFRCTA
ncbi:hypothetical protein [Humisphaera borealis]|uniref:Uncharacterized protein n=1 Tax=Humisphaera borealis TaxID=2807512 RepID=A0A7M2WZ26_9BACT|nr:hypothetical protein [Humisphaera borealis]QOV90101.1 hypothetical protein IPV69_01635 [Humisphaera borealis]